MRAITRSAFIADPEDPSGRRWNCPGCGGNCFGSSGEARMYYCHGNSLGTPTEQTQPCGYSEAFDDPRAPPFRPSSRLARIAAAAGRKP